MTLPVSARLPVLCLIMTCAVFVWSGVNPYERHTWWMEVAPVLLVLPLLIATWKKFPLTGLLYVLIAVHCIILLVGGHYTYARVPLFDDIRDWLGAARNSYDGVGHFAQGFIPAMAARELLLRTSPLRSGKWMFVLITLGCLGISALYELIEWGAAMMGGEGAAEFLGTQGDVWDTQKDMALAGVGTVMALLLLGRWHDRQLEKI